MLRVLREKLIRLGRDEDGAALVVTLAVFMFMWLVCAGVFAVGTAVKTRIHLQNACDAAAYSAAVVQADTLSRIATINRAMSWTYVQMTRRQMDYIVYRWLEETCRRYYKDKAYIREYHLANSSSAICPLRRDVQDVGWHIGQIKLNLRRSVPVGSIEWALSRYSSSWLMEQWPSFYPQNRGGISKLRSQIVNDKNTIGLMNDAQADLVGDLPSLIESTAEEMVLANIDGGINDDDVVAIKTFPDSKNGFIRVMGTESGDEDKFLNFAHHKNGKYPYYETTRTVFDKGERSWFPRSDNAEGFLRAYSQKSSCLKSQWEWWSLPWHCSKDIHGHHCIPGAKITGETLVRGADVYESDTFVGARAKPIALRDEYFGQNGTITVGISVKNQNPWSVVLGNIGSEIYAAFNPFVENTVVFASAKAGYKYLGDRPQSRDYRIDWNGDHQDWNLCQSDWDAVLIPVRMAQSRAINGRWEGVGRFLYGWVSALGVDPNRVFAGGTETPQQEYPKAFNEWKQMGATPYRTHRVNARWRVQNNAKTVRWDELTDRMFH